MTTDEAIQCCIEDKERDPKTRALTHSEASRLAEAQILLLRFRDTIPDNVCADILHNTILTTRTLVWIARHGGAGRDE